MSDFGEGIAIKERFCYQDEEKTARRQAMEQKYRVLFLAGDNLGNFSEEFVAPKVQNDDERTKAMEERAAKVDKQP